MSRLAPAILTRTVFSGILMWGAFASTIACAGPKPQPNIRSDDTGEAITGMKRAVREQDRSALPQLIKELDSDDPAVRFYASQALRRLTGQDLGYEFFQDESARKPAVERWQKWLEAGGDKPQRSDKNVSG